MSGPPLKSEDLYHETDVRNDWDHPTHAQMIESLNKAHDANRVMAADIGRLRSQLFRSKIKNYALVATLGGAAATGIERGVQVLIKRFLG